MIRARLAASSALVALVLAVPAHAAMTPEQVWQSWQTLSAGYGQTLAAESVARQGDTLVVTGMTVTMDEDGAKLEGKLDELRLKDLGNGTVEITMSDSYPLTMTMPGENGPEDLAITLTQPGLKMIAAGDPTATDYTFDSPSVGMTIAARQNGETLADIAATLSALSGHYRLTESGTTSILDSNVNAQSLSFTVDATDKGTGGTVRMTGAIADVKLGSTGSFLGVAAMENMAQALRDGFSTSVDAGYGAGNFLIEVTEAAGTSKIAATNESGHFRMALGGEALAYAAGGTGVQITMSGTQIPFPELKLNYAEAAFDFLMPLAKSDAPKDFTFLARIVDLAVSDEIWAMIDPAANLPREPATVVIDTKGTARLTTDLMDEQAMAALGQTPPGEIHSLTVNALNAKIAGAELTGAGAFTFDNTDKVTFNGIPTPTGKIDLVLKGGNTLLDRLVAMGLVPPDQAQGARFMLSMFTREGEGPDTRNSTLEFKDKGFYANGQRLQ